MQAAHQPEAHPPAAHRPRALEAQWAAPPGKAPVASPASRRAGSWRFEDKESQPPCFGVGGTLRLDRPPAIEP
jgi:hypothetical protein